MRSLQVRNRKVAVPLRGRKVSVPQRPLQCKRVPALAKVVGCVAVPGRVERAGWWFEAHLAAESLDAAKDISPAQLGAIPCYEDKPIAGRVRYVAHQALAQFGTEGNDSRLAALPVQPHQQIVEVDGIGAQGKHLTDACSHVKQEQHNQVRSQISGAWLVCNQPMNLLLGVHGQVVLWFLESCEFRMLAARPAFRLRGRKPMCVGVPARDGAIDARWLQPAFTHCNHGVLEVSL